MNAVLRNHAADAGGRIDIGMTADNRARIENGIAANLNIVAQHSAELLESGLHLLRAIVHDDKSLVAFTLEVMDPAPIWLWKPRIESPT